MEWAIVVKQCKRVVGTKTFALLLRYTPQFQGMGLKGQQYGAGEKRRMLSLVHCNKQFLGWIKVLPGIKAHILTGNDCMSKVRTKLAAMAADPVYSI